MNEEFLRYLIQIDDTTISSVFLQCWEEYMAYLAEVASDIYDSCIAYYYADYYPVSYDRHGDISGFNLYRANAIEAYELDVSVGVDSDNLLPYNGKEKRDRVLSTVMDGIRGGGARTRSFRGWPRSWHVSYPNEFSKYGMWQSSRTTMDGILSEFVANAIKDTKDYFWNLFMSRI